MNSSAATSAAAQRRPDAEQTGRFRIFNSKSLVLVAILIALTACTPLHPRAPTRKPPAKSPDSVSVTSTSGIAVLDPGSYESDRRRIKAALSGNNADSLAPSEVGYYMDVLQGRLKQMAGQGLGVGRSGDRIAVVFFVRAGFEPGSDQINPVLRETMKPLSKVLTEYRKTFLSVRIRPEDAGTAASNPQLAEQRAVAAARYLVESGIAGKRIVVAGTGAGSRADQAPTAKAGAEKPVRIELHIEAIVHAADGKR